MSLILVLSVSYFEMGYSGFHNIKYPKKTLELDDIFQNRSFPMYLNM